MRISFPSSLPPSLLPYLEMRGDGSIHPPHQKGEEAAIPLKKGREEGKEGKREEGRRECM
jgi:hypothetical protein